MCNRLTTINTFLIILSAIFSPVAVGEMGQVRHFELSPDGSRILFINETSDGGGHSYASLMLFDLSREIISLTGEIKETALSPDRKIIAYIERDQYHGDSMLLMTSEGVSLNCNYHDADSRFSLLKWSRDSKYLSFISQKASSTRKTIVVSPQIGIAPDELANVEWQRKPEPLSPDNPLFQERPAIRADSTMIWGDDITIYVRTADGIWKGTLGQPFIIQWKKLVDAKNIMSPISISPMNTHLLYKRTPIYTKLPEIWVLSLEEGAVPVKIGEGERAQFTPDGENVLLVNVGLWMISIDGNIRFKLTGQNNFQ